MHFRERQVLAGSARTANPEKTCMDGRTETIHLHCRVLAGQEEPIPLIVSPPCGALPKAIEYGTDTADAARRAATAVRPKVEVGDRSFDFRGGLGGTTHEPEFSAVAGDRLGRGIRLLVDNP